MPILVTCPSCHSRFQVSDKFAGKKGPCPKCKTQIRVPTKDEEVVVHAPEEFAGGGKNAAGRPVLKPIARAEVKVQPAVVAGIVGGGLVTLVAALVMRLAFAGQVPMPILAFGALVLAPPLVLGGYTFLRDQELEPYRGTALWIRVGACSLVYAILWGVYLLIYNALLPGGQPELFHYLMMIPPMLVGGTLAAYAALDLEPTTAFFHYGMYLGVTMLLRLTMGLAAM